MISSQESRTSGLLFHGISSMLGDLARGVIKSNSRVKNSVLAHEIEGEKRLNEAWGEHAQLKKEMEARDKKAKEKEEKDKEEIAQLKKEMEARDKKAKEKEEKDKEEITQLKKEIVAKEEEMGRISVDRDQFKADRDFAEGKLQVKSESLARKVSENLKMKEKVDRVQKELENKQEVIGQLQSTNEGLNRAFDFTADVNQERGVLDAQVEKTDLEAKNAKRSREHFEGDVVLELKKVHVAVGHLRNGDIDTGLKLLGESEEQLAPTLSKNQKRQLRRNGNKARKEGDDSLLMMGGGGSGGSLDTDIF